MEGVVVLATPELGDRSYLVHDGELALVVDPQRDIARVLEAAKAEGVRISHVAETHVHNDYLSGGLELARVTGAEYLVAAAEEVAFARRPITPGERVTVGRLELEAVATPGHTPHHLAYVVRETGRVQVVCTGGSLLLGTVGRTDLVDPAGAAGASRAQYRAVRALAEGLPDETVVLPTHGFGSFCSAVSAPPGGDTLGEQRRANRALSSGDEESFVAELLGGLTAYPRYYVRMGPANRAGPGPLPSPPELVDPGRLAALLPGDWVVDLRHRRTFAAGHLAGTLSFELAQPFTTYLGWLLPDGARLVLLARDRGELEEAATALARIGVLPTAGILGELGALAAASAVPVAAFPVASFADLAAAWPDEPVVVDVRRPDEWSKEHLAGARNIFVACLPDRLEELPEEPLWVHCASGYRAGVAASLLRRAGRQVVLVDDEWENVRSAGLPVV